MPSLQGKLSVERMCALAQISRAGFYRWLQRKQPGVEETAVRAAIQEVAVEHHRRYGYRRITEQGSARIRKKFCRILGRRALVRVEATDSGYLTAAYGL